MPKMFDYVCPSCGVTHSVEVEKVEDYDGLCEKCEEEWVSSPEYQAALNSL